MTLTNPRRRPAAPAGLALAFALAGACAAPLEEAERVARAAPPSAAPERSLPSVEALAVGATAVALPGLDESACAALPDLSAPARSLGRGDAFELVGARVADRALRSPCRDLAPGDAQLVARFTAPASGRWQLRASFDGDPGYRLGLALFSGCAPGGAAIARRCAVFRDRVHVDLAAGETVTVLVEGVRGATAGALSLRAERAEPVGNPPWLADARLERALTGAWLTVNGSDREGDLDLVRVTYLDARGAPVPVEGRAALEQHTAADGERPHQLGLPPPGAVGARVELVDAEGSASNALEVPFVDAHVRAPGEPCGAYGRADSCVVSARCIYERSTGERCRERADVRFDPATGALRVDLDSNDVTGLARVTVALLDDQGARLEAPSTVELEELAAAPRLGERRELLAREDWRPARWPARVVLRLEAKDGATLATFAAPVREPARATPFMQCDPNTAARVRCDEGYSCTNSFYSSGDHRCERRDAACSAGWTAAAWSHLRDRVAEQRTSSRPATAPSCVAGDAASGVRVFDTLLEFAAPADGTYRVALAPREGAARPGVPRAPAAPLALTLYPRSCGGTQPVEELGCEPASRGAVPVQLEQRLSAGEHIVVRALSRGAPQDVRVEVTRLR